MDNHRKPLLLKIKCEETFNPGNVEVLIPKSNRPPPPRRARGAHNNNKAHHGEWSSSRDLALIDISSVAMMEKEISEDIDAIWSPYDYGKERH